jgi:hypothetical protein
MPELGGACGEVVRAAAARSLTAEGVRVYTVRIREDGAGGWTDPYWWRTGVANPAGRAVKVDVSHADDSPVVRLAETAAARWPWLDDEPDGTDPDDRTAGGEVIEVGRRSFWRYTDDMQWLEQSAQSCGPANVLWGLEAILATRVATEVTGCEVRGSWCRQYRATIRPGDLVGKPGIELIDAAKRVDDWAEVVGDASIDDAGLIRRIMWSPTIGRRFKPGLLPRFAQRLSHDPPAAPVNSDRPWTILELWDYDCPVQIAAPTDLLERGETSLTNIACDLWRIRRDYKRRHR